MNDAIESVSNATGIMVGVAGVYYRIGTTHICIAMAKHLQSMGYSVALLENNTSEVFESIMNEYDLLPDADGMFSLHGICFYLHKKQRYALNRIRAMYTYVIIDFGTCVQEDGFCFDDFLMCRPQILVGGSRPWELNYISNVMELSYENEHFRELVDCCSLVVNFAGENTKLQETIKNGVLAKMRDSVYFAPIFGDFWTDFNWDGFNDILGIIVREQENVSKKESKHHSFFSLKGELAKKSSSDVKEQASLSVSKETPATKSDSLPEDTPVPSSEKNTEPVHVPVTDFTGCLTMEEYLKNSADFEIGRLGVICVDVDGLSKINNDLGYTPGNHVIECVGKVLLSVFDFAKTYHCDGGKFLIILNGYNAKFIDRKIETMDKELLNLTNSDADGIVYSISSGYCINDGTYNLKQMQCEAERLMNVVKKDKNAAKNVKDEIIPPSDSESQNSEPDLSSVKSSEMAVENIKPTKNSNEPKEHKNIFSSIFSGKSRHHLHDEKPVVSSETDKATNIIADKSADTDVVNASETETVSVTDTESGLNGISVDNEKVDSDDSKEMISDNISVESVTPDNVSSQSKDTTLSIFDIPDISDIPDAPAPENLEISSHEDETVSESADTPASNGQEPEAISSASPQSDETGDDKTTVPEISEISILNLYPDISDKSVELFENAKSALKNIKELCVLDSDDFEYMKDYEYESLMELLKKQRDMAALIGYMSTDNVENEGDSFVIKTIGYKLHKKNLSAFVDELRSKF